MASALTNHQVRLAARPEGLATRDNWQFTEEPVGDSVEGGVVVRTILLSLDPAMRGWMNDSKSYIAPVGVGDVMRAVGIGRVHASRTDAYPVGAYVTGGLGVQEYARFDPAGAKKAGLAKIDPRLAPLPKWLNALGMPGMTA
ncbi:MAG: NADP-dependent oxidoreductase, partial [Burkholderiaceae bacterium]